MTDDYTINSHFITYIFLFEKVRRTYFLNLGVKGLCVSLLPSVLSIIHVNTKHPLGNGSLLRVCECAHIIIYSLCRAVQHGHIVNLVYLLCSTRVFV